jgi:hypothetical protein
VINATFYRFSVPPVIALLLVLLGVRSTASASEVILMRHGHKDVSRGDFNLSPQGLERALALGRLIPACFGRPTKIISYPFNRLTGKNSRSYQTLVPLASATGLNIEIVEDAIDHSEAVGARLRASLASHQERLVLAWEHVRMPLLARGLGMPAMQSISNEDFDQILVFRYASPTAVPKVQLYRQSELLLQPCYQGTKVKL